MPNRYVVVFIAFMNIPLCALVVGSDTAPSRQTTVTFPALDTNNTIMGFAFMEGGFALQNFTTTCSFNSYFPVASTVNLRGGELHLLRDLEIQSQFSVGAPGSFVGNTHTLSLTSTNPVVIPVTEESAFSLQATYVAPQDLDVLDWDYTGAYLTYAINGGGSNKLFGILGFGITSLTSLVTNSSNGNRNLNAIRFHPSTHYLALGVLGDATRPGIQIWEFNSSGPSLTQIDTDLASRTVRSVAWHPSGDYLALGVEGSGGQIYVYPFDSGTGALGTPITATLPTTATFGLRSSVDWAPGGDYLAVGVTANTSTELQLYYFDGVTLTFTLGAEIGQQVNTVSWSQTGSFIAVGLNGSTTRLRVYEHVVQDGTLNLVDSPSGQTRNVLGVHWRQDGNALAVGIASGAGSDFFIYSFDTSTKTATLQESVDPGTTVNDVRWSPGECYVAFGSDANQLRVYVYSDGSCSSDYPLIFNNISLLFDADIFFKVPVIVQGNCVFNGHGNRMAFGDESLLTLDAGASLLCQSLTMTTLSTSKFIMADTTSSISLQDVRVALDDDWTFTQGFLTFLDEVVITGTTTFTYASSRQAIIESEATLVMDGGLTFSYDPPSATGNLFSFRDETSVWCVDDVTWHTTTTGLALTKGTLKILSDLRIESEAGTAAEGVKFGNGSASDNVTIEILPGAGLDVVSGYVVYDNV